MLSIPFLKRQKYIEVKAYTNHLGVYEHAPVCKNFKTKIKRPDASLADITSFYTGCWSRVNTGANSITLQSPCEIKIDCLGLDGCEAYYSEPEIVSIDFNHNTDTAYPDRDFFISKFIMPWVFEDNLKINFVIARHIENTTMVNVLSGLLNFRTQPAVNIFNVISKIKHNYKIPPKHPLVSIYAMSDLPLHLEVYHDPTKYHQLFEKHHSLYFQGTSIKLDRKERTKPLEST